MRVKYSKLKIKGYKVIIKLYDRIIKNLFQKNKKIDNNLVLYKINTTINSNSIFLVIDSNKLVLLIKNLILIMRMQIR